MILRTLLIAAACLLAHHAHAQSPTVTVSEGVVVGTTTTLPGATAPVNHFLSIPFAVTPPERFLPPVKPAAWKVTINATKLPAACVQTFLGGDFTANRTRFLFNNPGGDPPAESEDCLYLNIYTPSTASSDSGLPVLFWLYGGAFIFGSSSLDYYDGSSFAYHQDVIVVTSNYRTNVLAFSSSDEIPVEKVNAGLHDQRLALNWVSRNIKSFGGDPSKITIFGESAGAVSVKQLIANPPNPLPFRAAILESEAFLPARNPDVAWQTLVAELGCDTASSPLQCAQQADANKVRDIVEQNSLIFLPVDDGGVTLINDIRDSIDSGKFANVPTILGSNLNEGTPFAYIAGLDDPRNTLNAALSQLLPNNSIATLALQALYAGSDPFDAFSDIFRLFEIQCPTGIIAAYMQNHNLTAYRYLYNATFPNTEIFPDAGVWHTSEIPNVFGTYPEDNALGRATQRQMSVSQNMQTTWANFAKDPSSGPGWAVYGSDGVIAVLGGSDGSQTTQLNAGDFDQGCTLFSPIIDVLGV